MSADRGDGVSTQRHGDGKDADARDEARDGGPSNAVIVFREILHWLIVPVLIVIILRCFFFGLYIIPSGSMENTLDVGDRVVTSRLDASADKIKRGDIIVFRDPANWLNATKTDGESDNLIKRVIGLPGDTVSCEGSGSPITINGVAIDESAYLRSGVQPSEFPFTVTVTDGNLFVLGDNRSNSADSRYHTSDGNDGLVPIADVVGVAKAVYFPFSHMTTLSDHPEVFADVPDPDGQGSDS
ncbi:MAG: signal peptidase I [Bifidobacteriaceae bacterium]|nr:signal peptidase I [Bifidobacteriaceae bacterium]